MKNLRKILAFCCVILMLLTVLGAMALPAFAADTSPPGNATGFPTLVLLIAAGVLLVTAAACLLLRRYGVKVVSVANIIAKIIQMILSSGASYTGTILNYVLGTVYSIIAYVLNLYSTTYTLPQLVAAAMETIKTSLAQLGIAISDNDLVIINVCLYVGFAVFRLLGITSTTDPVTLYDRLSRAVKLDKAVAAEGRYRLQRKLEAT